MVKARVVRLRCYWLAGGLLLLAQSAASDSILVDLEDADASRQHMRYCDHAWPIHDMDDFMNRIVAINKIGYMVPGGEPIRSQVVAPGVFINNNHILTSYTPFRRLASTVERLRYDRDLGEFYVTYYKAKQVDANNVLKGYLLETVGVVCGRQIFPNSSTDFDQSEKFLHFPNYDLMVFKTDKKIKFIDVPYISNVRGMVFWVIGPEMTKLVNSNSTIGDRLKYVSLGMVDYDHIYNRNHLHTVSLDTNDRLLDDCEEWFDEVNNFICIKVVDSSIAIGSGAFLFSEESVIGVGCFTITKGKESVHVFTDVRNVLELINTTCTEFDGFPDPTTKRRVG